MKKLIKIVAVVWGLVDLITSFLFKIKIVEKMNEFEAKLEAIDYLINTPTINEESNGAKAGKELNEQIVICPNIVNCSIECEHRKPHIKGEDCEDSYCGSTGMNIECIPYKEEKE